MNRPATIALATPEDSEAIAIMLKRLAEHLGVGAQHKTTAETVRRYGFGDRQQFGALIAHSDRVFLGLSLFFPMFSTTLGSPGVYVQDLWVEPSERGSGLGKRLLAATSRHAAESWSAEFLKLTVHADNTDAEAFYDRIGFEGDEREKPLTIGGEAFHLMRNSP